ADELLDLEIEIPVPGEAEEERVGAAVGDIERFAGNGEEEASRQRVNTLTSEDADVENASLHSWYQASDRPDRDSEEDNDKEEQEDQEQETEEAQDEHTSKTTESAAAAAEHSAGSKNGDAVNGSTDAHKQAERGKGKERGGWHAPSDSPRFPRSPANSPAAGAGHHPPHHHLLDPRPPQHPGAGGGGEGPGEVEGGQSGSGYPLLAGSVPPLTRTPS
ncbi:unnamed protein product, partial [Ectocarpus sp. 12 AP-2014]